MPLFVPVVGVSGNDKSGVLSPGDFVLTGGVYKATVVFAAAYPDTSYSVALNVETVSGSSFVVVCESRTTSGFVVSLGSNKISNLVAVMWQTTSVSG